jgi:tungstate transport system substrate-binding protein
VFLSRGDNSGTNKKEKYLWKFADIPLPQQETWYRQTGQGMLATLNISSELKGYTLTDRGTYIKYEYMARGKPDLVIHVEGDPVLKNQYSIIPVNPSHCAEVKNENAETFSTWMAGDRGQDLVGKFKLMNKQLFIPNAARE